MDSFEQEIKDFFAKYKVKYINGTDSTTDLDFSVKINGNIFNFDAKEKRQRYNMSSWTNLIPEEDCFILDELGIRKVMYYGIDSGIIIRNNLLGDYVFLNFLNLVTMPKLRVNRKVNTDGYLKGKWIINLNNGLRRKTLEDIFIEVKRFETYKDNLFFQSECYGNYSGEIIDIRGITRTNEYKHIDYTLTR